MKYAHIGIEDQAKALSGLPLPKLPKEVAGKNWQRSGSGTGVSPCQTTSSSVSEGDSEDEEGELKNPCNSRGSVTKCQPKSSFGMTFDEWRRRESNPNGDKRNLVTPQQVTTIAKSLSGNCQDSVDTDFLRLSSIDTKLKRIIAAWPILTEELRTKILALCMEQCASTQPNASTETQEEVRRHYLEQQRRRACPGCAEEPFFG